MGPDIGELLLWLEAQKDSRPNKHQHGREAAGQSHFEAPIVHPEATGLKSEYHVLFDIPFANPSLCDPYKTSSGREEGTGGSSHRRYSAC